MSVALDELCSAIETLWPVSGAEAWDAPGLVTGNRSQQISTVVFVVDVVAESVDDAIQRGADLVFAHHPLLLRGVTTVAEDTYKGALLARLIRSDTALMTAHTNGDVAAQGTSVVLAEKLGLTGLEPLVPGEQPGTGLGCVGVLPQAVSLGRLARTLAEVLPATASGVRVGGDFDETVRRVAVCGGAGDSLLRNSKVLASDAYITADLRHHPASEALENHRLGQAPALLDVSHWASEWLWLETAAQQLREAVPGIDVIVSDVRTDPWDFVIVQ